MRSSSTSAPARRSVRADGTVVALDARGSGEFPVVSFTPAGAREPVTAWLLQAAPRSTSFTIGNSALGFEDSCASVALRPHHDQMFVFLERRDGRWRVVRAGPSDPDCAVRLE